MDYNKFIQWVEYEDDLLEFWLSWNVLERSNLDVIMSPSEFKVVFEKLLDKFKMLQEQSGEVGRLSLSYMEQEESYLLILDLVFKCGSGGVYPLRIKKK